MGCLACPGGRSQAPYPGRGAIWQARHARGARTGSHEIDLDQPTMGACAIMVVAWPRVSPTQAAWRGPRALWGSWSRDYIQSTPSVHA